MTGASNGTKTFPRTPFPRTKTRPTIATVCYPRWITMRPLVRSPTKASIKGQLKNLHLTFLFSPDGSVLLRARLSNLYSRSLLKSDMLHIFTFEEDSPRWMCIRHTVEFTVGATSLFT